MRRPVGDGEQVRLLVSPVEGLIDDLSFEALLFAPFGAELEHKGV